MSSKIVSMRYGYTPNDCIDVTSLCMKPTNKKYPKYEHDDTLPKKKLFVLYEGENAYRYEPVIPEEMLNMFEHEIGEKTLASFQYDSIIQQIDLKSSCNKNTIIYYIPYAMGFGFGPRSRMLQTLEYFIGNKFNIHLVATNKDSAFEPELIDYFKNNKIQIHIDDSYVETEHFLLKKINEIRPEFCFVNFLASIRLLAIFKLIAKISKIICDVHDIEQVMRISREYVQKYCSNPLPYKDIKEFNNNVKKMVISNYNKSFPEEKFKLVTALTHISPDDMEIYKLSKVGNANVFVPFILNEKFKPNYKRAVIVSSNNLYNVPSFIYFAKFLLPKLLKAIPDLQIDLYGTICKELDRMKFSCPNVNVKGIFNKPYEPYENASFSINITMFGSGTKTKINESISYNVPVLSHDVSAGGSILVHNFNGLIAGDEDDFVKCFKTMYRDTSLCKKFGKNCQETLKLVKKEYNKNMNEIFVDRTVKKLYDETKEYDMVYLDKNDEFKKLTGHTMTDIMEKAEIDFEYFCWKNDKLKLETIDNKSILNAVLLTFEPKLHLDFILKNTMNKLGNKWQYTVVCCDKNYDDIVKLNYPITIIKLDKNEMTNNDINNLLLDHTFWEKLNGETILLYNTETIIFNNQYEKFLEYDLVGCPMYHYMDWDINNVGSGGLSLRNKQKVIELANNYGNVKLRANAIKYQKMYGYDKVMEFAYYTSCKNVKIADWQTSMEFGMETIKSTNPFAGYRWWNCEMDWKARLLEYTLEDVTEEIIPKIVHIMWHTKDLPEKMKEHIQFMKNNNPDLEFILYDDSDCYDFIKENFNENVLDAFNRLIPGAYKSDLARYCIMYKLGGIYMDIKLKTNVRLNKFLDKEYFVMDDPDYFNGKLGLFNAFMISKPNNEIFNKCIERVIKNVDNNFYGENPYQPTGPGLLGNIWREMGLLEQFTLFNRNRVIYYEGIGIMNEYPEYRREQKINQKTSYYVDLWKNKTIYFRDLDKWNAEGKLLEFAKKEYKPVIPLILHTMWHEKPLPKSLQENIDNLAKDNPEIEIRVYDEKECGIFIKQNYDEEILDAYERLVPHAYKSDLARYCILYKIGGMYLDSKLYFIKGFKLISLTENEFFCKDTPEGIINGIIGVKPNNKIMLECIKKIVRNVNNNFYGKNWLEPTGPVLFGEILKNFNIGNNLRMVHSNKITYYDNIPISTEYVTYRKEQKSFQKVKSYWELWKEKKIYKLKEPNVLDEIIPQYCMDDNRIINSQKYFLKNIFNITYEKSKENLNLLRKKALDIINKNLPEKEINKITHKIWITNPDNIYLPPDDIIDIVRKHYTNLNDYEHYFWCNIYDVGLKIVNLLNLPDIKIKVCDLNEFEEYPATSVYNLFFKHRLFANACDIARIQIVHKYGGLYSDMGFEIKSSFSTYIKNFDIMINGENDEIHKGTISHNVLYSKKEKHKLFETSLMLMENKQIIKELLLAFNVRGILEITSPRYFMTGVSALCNDDYFLLLTNNDKTFSRKHTESHIHGKFGSAKLINNQEFSKELYTIYCSDIKNIKNIKILHLVLYNNDIHYNSMKSITEKYYSKFNWIDTFYYQFNENIENNYEIDKNLIFIKGKETFIPGILYKTIKTINIFSDDIYNNKYNYVVRSNISTIINFDLLHYHLINEKIDYGSSYIHNLQWMDKKSGIIDKKNWGTQFASGTNIILSNTTVKKILENADKIDYSIIDDVAIGILLKKLEIDLYNIKNSIIFLENNHINIDHLDYNKNIFYRLKQSNRINDINNMRKIIDIIDNKKD